MTAGGDAGAARRREREQLFRAEALASHAEGRSGGRVVNLTDRVAAWAFAAMMAALAVVAAASLLVGVDESATGRAVVPAAGAEAVLLLPAGTHARLRPGLAVDLDVAGQRVRTTLVSVGGALSLADADREYGVRPPGTTGAAVVVARAALPAEARAALAGGGTGTGVVVLARRSVAAMLLNGT